MKNLCDLAERISVLKCLPLTLIKSNATHGFLAVMQSSYKLIKDLPTDLLLLGLCFIFGMTLSGYLIRRYWTGKITDVEVLQATIIECDFADFLIYF